MALMAIGDYICSSLSNITTSNKKYFQTLFLYDFLLIYL